MTIGKKIPGNSKTTSCRTGSSRTRRQEAAASQFQSQRWIPSATSVEVSGTTLHSAPAEKVERKVVERVGRVERVEESSSSRRAAPKVSSITHKARDPHREKAQGGNVGQRMGAGRVAGRISVTNARRGNLATKVERDILESDRLEVYKQWVRA